MAKRNYDIVKTCSEPGCNEVTVIACRTRKAHLAAWTKYTGWKCLEHEYPERNLTPTNRKIVYELTAKVPDDWRHAPKLFWHSTQSLTSGYAHGEGWQAHADRFPAGSIIRITAEVILPDDQTDTEEGEKCPHCKGLLEWNSMFESWYCSHCDVTIEDFELEDAKTDAQQGEV